MKTLIYKIIKTELPNPDLKVVFNREHYISELKKEIGLADIAFEDITLEHMVQLNSPTGRTSSFKINAKDYIENELVGIEQDINNYNLSQDEPQEVIDLITIQVDEKNEKLIRETIEKSDEFIEWVEETPLLIPVEIEQKLDNFVYYDVKLPNGMQYTVVIYKSDDQKIVDQINKIENHFCTIHKRNRDMLTGNELIISFSSWFDLVSGIELPTTNIDKFENVDMYKMMQDKMTMLFEGGITTPRGF